MRLKPESASPYFGLITALKRTCSYEHALIHYFKAIIASDPHNIEALTQLAILRMLRGEDTKCVRLLRKTLQINNFFVPALLVTGELLLSRQ